MAAGHVCENALHNARPSRQHPQADKYGGQDGGILAEFFFCVFMDRDEVEVHEVHKHAKKERGQYPAILTEQAWSIKDSLYDFFEH